MMPDIGWCTSMAADGLPWHADVNMKASSAAALLNAIPMALEWMHEQELEESVEVPDDLPTIRHRMAYCVVAEGADVEAAMACIDDDEECPSFYHLGGVTGTVPAYEDPDSDAYFEKLWDEFDQATTILEGENVTAKPVAMLSSVYSGDLLDDGIEVVVGCSGSTGDLGWEKPDRLGGTIVEADEFVFALVAHELGHQLGLSHTISNGAPVNLNGFMQEAYPFPVLSLLGPSEEPQAYYGYANQWRNWSDNIGNKTRPRPNAFGWTGCDGDWDCPSQLECWFFEAMVPGVCLEPL